MGGKKTKIILSINIKGYSSCWVQFGAFTYFSSQFIQLSPRNYAAFFLGLILMCIVKYEVELIFQAKIFYI